MKHRPRLLVFLAFFYLLSPVLYPAIISWYFDTPFSEALKQTTAENSLWRNIEIFVIPVILAGCIFFARRLGYFVVVIGSLYLGTRSVYLFLSTNEMVPTSMLVATNLLFVMAVVYFLKKNTRAIYFNPKVRWWETEARYVVNFPGTMTRLGAQPSEVIISDIALGGAAIETNEKNFLSNEMIRVEFKHAGIEYQYTAGIVWHRPLTEGKRLLGTRWIAEGVRVDRPSMRKLISELRAKGTPTTAQAPGWWDKLRAWVIQS